MKIPFSKLFLLTPLLLLLAIIICSQSSYAASSFEKIKKMETQIQENHAELIQIKKEYSRSANMNVVLFASVTLLLGSIFFIGRNFSKVGAKIGDSVEDIVQLENEKASLNRELNTARSIQMDLIPNQLPETEHGIDLAARYVPATHVAGDWFNFKYNEETGENVIVLVDVAGHGLGAAMFTAIIATIFQDETDNWGESRFNHERFVKRLNSAIFKLGKGNWHATCQTISFVKGETKLRMINAGHPFMFHLTKDKENPAQLMNRTDVIGLTEHFKTKASEYDFPIGSRLVMYTDGLVEARPFESQKDYGKRRLRKILKNNNSNGVSPNDLLTLILNDCQQYMNSTDPEDDICIIAFDRAS